MKLKLFTAWSNVTRQQTPEFACRRDWDAARLAARYLNCPVDDVAIVFDEVDPWVDQARVTRAVNGLKKVKPN